MRKSEKFKKTVRTKGGFPVSGLVFKGPFIFGWLNAGKGDLPTKWNRATGAHDTDLWKFDLEKP